MNLDVIDATAEALPLELLNKVNKELTVQLSHYEEQLEEKSKTIEDQRKRLQFMKEHLGNVRAEIVNTQSLSESKRKEVESEDNMKRLIERECGRLQQRQVQLHRQEEETQDQITALQNRIFQGNLKMDEFKTAMDFNQEELEQWDEARRQKEEDELAIAQYSKQDEAKIKQMTLTIERLEGVVRESRRQLEAEVMATRHVQNDLDTCAAEYRKLHDDRGGLLDEWERVVRTIAERDDAIRVAAEQYAEGVEWLQRRVELKKELSDELDRLNEEMEVINFTISEREKQAQQLRDALPPLAQQVQEMEDEVESQREEVRRCQRDKRQLLARLEEVSASIGKKVAELDAVQRRREVAAQRLQNEIEAAEDMQQQTALIAQLLADAQKADKSLDKDVEQLKKTQFQANQGLSSVREKQSVMLSEISGAQAQGKNLNAKINQLDGESFSQQSVLYNIEFSVQQMEKKVNRARGDRTEEEMRELRDKIALLQTTLDELEQQFRVLDVQVKRVREELRQCKVEIERLEVSKKRATDLVLEINLQCGHSEQDAKKLEKQREDALIQVDTMELQLNRLRRTLRLKSNELVDLEERKRQLRTDVAEREEEIAIHHNLLKMEAKLCEEERKQLVSELLERQKRLKAIRNRQEVLVGRMDPAQARMSQAQLVVEAAKERESLQYRGDSLDGRIKRMEREMLKLEKTIAVMKASNNTFKHKFDRVTDEHDEVKTHKILKEKFRELKAAMSRRALETNDYQATLDLKRGERDQLLLQREQLEATLGDVQQDYDLVSQDVLHSREAVIRYEQAITKAQTLVDDATRNDVALLETRERLQLVVERLLECSRRAGEEVYEAVRTMVLEKQLPVGEPGAVGGM